MSNINIETEEKIYIKDLKDIENKISNLNIPKIGTYYITTSKYIFKNNDLNVKLKGISIKTKSVIENGKKTYLLVIKGKNTGNDKLRIRKENEKTISSIVKYKNLIARFMNVSKEYFKIRNSYLYTFSSGKTIRLDLDVYDDLYSQNIILELEGDIDEINKMKGILEFDKEIKEIDIEEIFNQYRLFNEKDFKIEPGYISLMMNGKEYILKKDLYPKIYSNFLTKYKTFLKKYNNQLLNNNKQNNIIKNNNLKLIKHIDILNSPFEQIKLMI